ncbi:spermidine/putrescine import permease PotB [Candidatus Mycoplasma haematolamae str. Purdue]|uniref:Spermidine/putrescine import permease PotB n=1 Tax=Mycoplasma haematolamae (strain Purdue) TaxID=1212765 RepID=I7CIE6_MYCHA|nr:spermidine/putrescine ABC transporter permease [Candidatus Mycoplasma haematolamae]AFO51624.1 spermidine/putrescine import permease PotB [Candidatus Mycoplasma haematolamae str. Purdue]
MKLALNCVYLKVRKFEPLFIPFVIFAALAVALPAVLLTTYSFKVISEGLDKSKLGSNLFESLALSAFIALCALIITLFISFPLAALICSSCDLRCKKKVLLLLAFPLVSNYFIRLIGLKSCFDFFHGRMNSTYGFGWTIFGLVYLSLPLVIYNFINTISSLPKNRLWALRDLGHTYKGEFFVLLLPWSKATFLSSSILFFLPALFTTFISEFLNNENSSRMVGEVIAQIFNLTSYSAQHARPFMAFLVSLLFTIVIFSLVFGAGAFKATCLGCKKCKEAFKLKVRREENRERAERNFASNLLLFN